MADQVLEEHPTGPTTTAMKPCISQVTTLMNPFESDASAYRGGGWTAAELWLTKLEAFVQAHSAAEARSVFESAGVRPVAAAGQGGLLLSRGAGRDAHWDHFRRRLELLRALEVPTLIVAADPAAAIGRAPDLEDFAHAAAALGEAAELAGSFGVRIALEFQKSSPICACLETAIAMAAQCGSRNAGVCLDAFHFQTGPSKLEDFDGVPVDLIAWVQLCDVAGTPRELAGDADRILPGDGDFPLSAIVERLARTGYDGYVSLELLNPHLWKVAADRVTDVGQRALRRVLGPHLDESGLNRATIDGDPAVDREGGP
jgi:2-keto-myo-inositol isomerase